MKKQLSGFFYLIPILTIVFGITLFVIILVKDIKALITIEDHHRIFLTDKTLDETHIVKFEEEGKYYLFTDNSFVNDVIVEEENDESHVLVRDDYPELDRVQKFTIRVYKKGDESNFITVHDMPKNQSITHTINNDEYTAIMYVEVDEVGEYEVIIQNEQDEYGFIDEILFRQFEFSSVVYGVVKYLGVIGGTLAISITSFVIIFVKRRKTIQTDE